MAVLFPKTYIGVEYEGKSVVIGELIESSPDQFDIGGPNLRYDEIADALYSGHEIVFYAEQDGQRVTAPPCNVTGFQTDRFYGPYPGITLSYKLLD